MAKRARRSVATAWYTLLFVVVAASGTAAVVTGVRLLVSGPECGSVLFDMTASVRPLCVADGSGSSGDMSSGAAGWLLVGPGLLLLTASTMPVWRSMRYRRALRRRALVEPGPPVPMARAVLPERVEPMLVTPHTVAPPPDEWSGLRATHPNAFGPVMHAAESIPKEQWPADATRALGRACVLFTSGGLDANRAVQRAFEEATSGAIADAASPDDGDGPSGVRLPPRLPPR